CNPPEKALLNLEFQSQVLELKSAQDQRDYLQKNPLKPQKEIQVTNPKRQECQPRGEAQIRDARASTSSQMLANTYETTIKIIEAEITSIPVSRSKKLPGSSSRDIKVSVQGLVYGSKAAGAGTSDQIVDRDNELLPSSEEALGPRKDTRNCERLETKKL
ncbi:hypothetical protein O181_094472, partial [Austropuccinia psidii MF-1]|nr:hypothetical protein [Austropuccinia psidii MF-1]